MLCCRPTVGPSGRLPAARAGATAHANRFDLCEIQTRESLAGAVNLTDVHFSLYVRKIKA